MPVCIFYKEKLQKKGWITMSYDFNVDDVLEMAVQIEKNGSVFYRNAADKVADEDARAFLLDLAAMEDTHLTTFEAMKAQLTDADRQSTVFDPTGEAAQYLKALADTRVFFEKEIDLTSLKEILKSAITAEKDSIVFYLGMKDMVPDSHGQSKIDAIIKEEMLHIKILSRRLVTVK